MQIFQKLVILHSTNLNQTEASTRLFLLLRLDVSIFDSVFKLESTVVVRRVTTEMLLSRGCECTDLPTKVRLSRLAQS